MTLCSADAAAKRGTDRWRRQRARPNERCFGVTAFSTESLALLDGCEMRRGVRGVTSGPATRDAELGLWIASPCIKKRRVICPCRLPDRSSLRDQMSAASPLCRQRRSMLGRFAAHTLASFNACDHGGPLHESGMQIRSQALAATRCGAAGGGCGSAPLQPLLFPPALPQSRCSGTVPLPPCYTLPHALHREAEWRAVCTDSPLQLVCPCTSLCCTMPACYHTP